MEQLIEAQKAAHAAWAACQDKRLAEKAALAAALDAACKAVAAAKRAAAAQAAPVSVGVDAAIAAVAKRTAEAKAQRELSRAGALWLAAQEWPRCGEGWPYPGAEASADALLRANPAFAAGLEE